MCIHSITAKAKRRQRQINMNDDSRSIRRECDTEIEEDKNHKSASFSLRISSNSSCKKTKTKTVCSECNAPVFQLPSKLQSRKDGKSHCGNVVCLIMDVNFCRCFVKFTSSLALFFWWQFFSSFFLSRLFMWEKKQGKLHKRQQRQRDSNLFLFW